MESSLMACFEALLGSIVGAFTTLLAAGIIRLPFWVETFCLFAKIPIFCTLGFNVPMD